MFVLGPAGWLPAGLLFCTGAVNGLSVFRLRLFFSVSTKDIDTLSVKRMLRDGLSLSRVAEVSGWTRDEVRGFARALGIQRKGGRPKGSRNHGRTTAQ